DERTAGRDLLPTVLPAVARELADPERGGRKQPLRASEPGGGRAQVLRVGEDQNPHGFTPDPSAILHPVRSSAPHALLSPGPARIHHASGRRIQRLGHTNRERAFLGVTDRDHTLRGANGELTIDGSRPLVAAEAVSLHFLGQYAGRRRQVERGLEAAAIRTGLRLVQRAEGRAAEGRGGVIAPLWERRFSPEVEPVDVAMREVHRTLMWLVAVFTGDLRGDRISTRHDGAVRASQ